MKAAPLPPRCELGEAADTKKTDRESRLNKVSAAQSQERRRLRRRCQVEVVSRLGSARVWFELLDEVARHHPEIADDLDRRLARYAALDPEVLCALGVDRLPLSPVRIVGGAA